MWLKTLKILILVLFVSTCKNYESKNIYDIKNDLINNYANNNNLDINLSKYNIYKPSDFLIQDKNLYFLFAKIIIDNKEQNLDWFNFLIKNAINKDNLFRDDAIKLYFKFLLLNKNNIQAKELIKDNLNYLNKAEYQIYKTYSTDSNLDNLEVIPNDINTVLLLNEISNSNPSVFEKKDNQEKINKYLIESKIFKEKDFLYQNELKNIVNVSKNNNFLNCVYSFLTKNKSMFFNSLNLFLTANENVDYDKMNVLKELSTDFGERKNFYKYLSYYYAKNNYYKYFYGLEVITYESYRKGIGLLLESLKDFNDNSIINFNIRYILVNNSRSFTSDWINQLVKFINDYPDNKYSKSYLYYLISTAITQNKSNFLLPLLFNIDLNKLSSDTKCDLVYYFYLLDNENKEKWKNILISEFPLSFEALKLNNGNVKFHNNNTLSKLVNDYKMSAEGLNILKKINYLFDFKYNDDALKIDYSSLDKNEKVIILNRFYNYYISIQDYYKALKIARDMIEIVYNNNYYNINDFELIKRLYPQHFKDLIVKYSNEFNVDPALSYAVMREESNFKYNIVSYRNAIGLMQIIPLTARFIAKKLSILRYDLNNPEDNIKMGVYYINFLDKYFDKYEHIISSYNAGPNNTKRWSIMYNKYPEEIAYELIPIYETRNYVKNVMKSYYIYKFIIENDS